jgi:hypothetical protein
MEAPVGVVEHDPGLRRAAVVAHARHDLRDGALVDTLRIGRRHDGDGLPFADCAEVALEHVGHDANGVQIGHVEERFALVHRRAERRHAVEHDAAHGRLQRKRRQVLLARRHALNAVGLDANGAQPLPRRLPVALRGVDVLRDCHAARRQPPLPVELVARLPQRGHHVGQIRSGDVRQHLPLLHPCPDAHAQPLDATAYERRGVRLLIGLGLHARRKLHVARHRPRLDRDRLHGHLLELRLGERHLVRIRGRLGRRGVGRRPRVAATADEYQHPGEYKNQQSVNHFCLLL